MTTEIKKGKIAMWGCHTDEIGTITRKAPGGFYARYKSRFPKEDRNGRMQPVYGSRFLKLADVVDCVGFPPAGKVKVCER
jgi:hypothetical protein